MSIFRRRNLVKSLFSILIYVAIFLAGARVFPAPIQGRNMGAETAANARIKLLAAAENYLGTPYRYGGVDSRGLDCSGLVFVSFKDALDIQVPRTSESLYSWSERISPDEMRPGDLVFFVTNGRTISHVGIYAGNGQFIHAPSEGVSTGVMYSGLDEAYWQRTFAGGGRALPWDSQAEKALVNGSFSGISNAGARPTLTGSSSASSPTGRIPGSSIPSQAGSTGLFFGFGVSSSLGGFIDGSMFRGLSLQARIGYKGFFHPDLQIALELRPEWDSFLGVSRLPLTLAVGTDQFQVFAGPAYIIGQPQIASQNRSYNSGFSLLGEVGVSWAFRPITISKGALSVYSELVWQSYSGSSGQDMNFGADLAANVRFSLGLRYIGSLNI